MELTQQLTDLGLNEKQAAVYVAVLELGSGSALDISRSAQVKRSTVYVILDELRELGLVTELKTGTTTLFQAQEPERIGDRLQSQMSTFRSIKPLLDDLYLKEGSKPKVRFYSGIAQIQRLYEMFLVEHSKIDFFGADLEIFSQYMEPVFNKYTKEFQEGAHQVREVVTMNQFNLEYARKQYNRFHKIRVIDKQFQFFGDNAIYGNTVLITSFSDDPFAVTIESKDVAQTFRSLFEVAWVSARPPREIPKKELVEL